MDMFDFAGMLFGGSRTAPDAKTVAATGAGASDGGEVGITLDADVTPAEDTGVEGDADQTVIDLPTSPDVDEGDEVIVTLVGDGPLKTPVVTANPGSGDRMRALANSAKAVADAAQAVADAVGQHFWHDENGAHVTEATQDEWQQSQSGPNSLWNSLGMLFRDGLTNLLAVLTNGVAIYDGNGNAAENIVARLLGSGVQIGRDGEMHVSVDSDSVDVVRGTQQLITMKESSEAGFVGQMLDASETTEPYCAGMTASGDPYSARLLLSIETTDNSSDIQIDNDNAKTTMVVNGVDSIEFSDPYDVDGNYLQLGNPTYYQNSGNYAITTAGVTSLHNGPRITIPAGSYIFVGAWTFNTGSSSGQRNLQLGFRSGASGDIWGERVRVMAAANNYAVLNVSALRTFDAQTTVYLAGSSSMTSGSASAWITAVRLN